MVLTSINSPNETCILLPSCTCNLLNDLVKWFAIDKAEATEYGSATLSHTGRGFHQQWGGGQFNFKKSVNIT